MDRLKRLLHGRLMLFMLVFVFGCASPPPPKPTIIQASVSVGAYVNPDSGGRASPIVIRFYELKTLAAFNAADFFSLWDKERETLGSDLVAREELQMRPGELKSFDRVLQADTKYLAVIAAFRDLDRARWRGAVGVLTNRTSPVSIRVEGRSITITGE